ncbi:hypothetical protein MXB_2141, partial [Myxobolus squamalis]
MSFQVIILFLIIFSFNNAFAKTSDSNPNNIFKYTDPIKILEIFTDETFDFKWKYSLPKEDVIYSKLELRKDDSTLEIAEYNNVRRDMKLGNTVYSDIVQSFTFNKIILQNIPVQLNGYDIYICAIHRVGELEFKKMCMKYAKIKIK